MSEKPMTPEALRLATEIAIVVATLHGSHDDKFDALVAVIRSLGLPKTEQK